jgi:O-antigen ligase
MVAVFLLSYLLALTCLYRKQHCEHEEEGKSLSKGEYYVVWYAIRFTGLAIILSGTRGIWVGMLLPLCIVVYFYAKRWNRAVMKKLLVSFGLILLFFALTPAINYGLNLIRAGTFKENFLDRARSIYDLREDSNVGRLIIWKNSLVYATKHPFGTGYGNFIVSLVPDIPPGSSYADVASAPNLRYNLPQKFVSAHSLYLHLLVEVGIFGLIIFLLYYWKYLQAVWRFFWKYVNDKNLYTVFVASIGLTVLWFLAYGVFDITIFNDKVLLYFFISILLSGLMMRDYSQFARESTCAVCGPPTH